MSTRPPDSVIEERLERLRRTFLRESARAKASYYDEIQLGDYALAAEIPVEIVEVGIERAVNDSQFSGQPITSMGDCEQFIRGAIEEWRRRVDQLNIVTDPELGL